MQGPFRGYPAAPAATSGAVVCAALAEDRAFRQRDKPEDGIYRWESEAQVPFTRLSGVPLLRNELDAQFADWAAASARAADGPRSFAPLEGRQFGHGRLASDAEFKAEFDRRYPALRYFDFAAHGLVVAGGCVAGALMGDYPAPRGPSAGSAAEVSDIDVFLVGHATDEDAKRAIGAFTDYLVQITTDHITGVPPNFTVHRTKNCVTFTDVNTSPTVVIGGRIGKFSRGELERTLPPVQIILRRYTTKAEVVLSFDMGSSAMLWDGRAVWLSRLGLLAANHGANVLTLDARRCSYEYRLVKYFKRGYDLVLPALDVAALKAGSRLAYLATRAADRAPVGPVDPHACLLSYLEATKPAQAAREDAVAAAAAGRDGSLVSTSNYSRMGQVPYGDLARLEERNFRAARLGGADLVERLWAAAPYKRGLDIFAIQPAMRTDTLVNRLSNYIGDGRMIDLIGIKKVVDDATAAAVLGRVVGLDTRAISFLADAEEICRQLLGEMVDRLKPTVVIPFEFMRVEPGSCLIGPFSRHLVSPAEWYGDAGMIGLGQ